MIKRNSLLSAFALMAAVAIPAWSSFADDIKAVVHDVRGNPITDVRTNCVRTSWETASDECGAAPMAPHTRLASVYFEFNKSTLTPEATATLNELLATLRHKHIGAVTIAGYADAVGSNSYNLRLSEKRARAVQHYLKVHGFEHSNTDVRALGDGQARTVSECKGLKDGKLHACMQEDRRVDIELSLLGQ
jgi:outer membrane protein OmpA-like peptidoglycan-associated protein